VSCGICSASCAPMAVGPPARTGRDEVAEVRAFMGGLVLAPDDVVVIACEHGAGRIAGDESFEGAHVYATQCAGNLHTSVIELLLRGGAGGVMVASCPPRDCRGREGPKWLEERVHHGREAELRESLDRRRLRITYAGPGERALLRRELSAFRNSLRSLAAAPVEEDVELEVECDGPPAEEASG
jgi:coenzyme F420-reducing hydrogenase delta subunit